MRFLVDGMLGGLARWLRILGQDVSYNSSVEDNALLRLAQEENRILLTRDEELYQRATAKKITSALVLGKTEEERLAQIANTFGVSLNADMAETRCPECGSELRQRPKKELANEVPPGSLKVYHEFWRCINTTCGKVYWVGSHWKQLRQTLEEANKLARSASQ